MLRYSVRLENNTHKEKIKLKSIYFSPDLTYSSGVTYASYDLSEGETVEVSSMTSQMLSELRLSNVNGYTERGYVKYSQYIPVENIINHSAVNENNNGKKVSYIWKDGNIYYSYPCSGGDDSVFRIDGIDYPVVSGESGTSFCVYSDAKEYVKDGHLSLNGKEYSVRYGKTSGETQVIDTSDNSIYDIKVYDTFQMNSNGEEIPKYNKLVSFTMENEKSWGINVVNGYKARYSPCIEYGGEKIYFEKHYSSKDDGNGAYAILDGFGPTLPDGRFFNCNLYFDGSKFVGNPYTDIVNGPDNMTISIDGEDVTIFFSVHEDIDSDTIALITEEDNPNIMINDRIIAKSSSQNVIYNVKEEHYSFTDGSIVDSGGTVIRYIMHNGIRYDAIKNLGDKVIINDIEYPITYFGDSRNIGNGSIGYALINNSKSFFQIIDSGDTCQKIVYKGNNSISSGYTVMGMDGSSSTEYKSGKKYSINHHDGINVNGKIYTIEKLEHNDLSGNSVGYSEYVTIDETLEYEYAVDSVIGNNMFLCKPLLDSRRYSQDMMDNISEEMINAIDGKTDDYLFTVYDYTLGQKAITPYSYSEEALNSSGIPVSSLDYQISDISMYKIHDYTRMPVHLSRETSNDLYKSDLTSIDKYNDLLSDSVNPIVDMEKDTYFPSIFTESGGTFSDATEIEINMHFRTRSLLSWKINEDYGKSDINHEYSNWFIFDYQPYSQCISDSSSNVYFKNKLLSASDLIGLMYYTADDILFQKTKISKSFLRISYFSTPDENTQSLLATSTVFMNGNGLYEKYTPSKSNKGTYNVVSPKKIHVTGTTMNASTELKSGGSFVFDDETRLSSRLTIFPKNTTENSSEGFCAYFFKEYSDSLIDKNIYLKFEFFHAGVGRKIALMVPTVSGDTNTPITNWTSEEIDEFKKGYSIENIQKRMYVPMKCKYDVKERKYRYYFSGSEYNNSSFVKNDSRKIVFNLFELKLKNDENN